jgi:hypothetical protein
MQRVEQPKECSQGKQLVGQQWEQRGRYNSVAVGINDQQGENQDVRTDQRGRSGVVDQC